MIVHLNVEVYEPMYEHNDKKYIRFLLDQRGVDVVRRAQLAKSHLLRYSRVEDPLDGSLIVVKVPYRYRRVMCEVVGGVPVQALERGAPVQVSLEFCGAWNKEGYCGYSWKLKKLDTSKNNA